MHNECLIQIENKLLDLNDQSTSDFGLPLSNRSYNVTFDTMHVRTRCMPVIVKQNLSKLVTDKAKIMML